MSNRITSNAESNKLLGNRWLFLSEEVTLKPRKKKTKVAAKAIVTAFVKNNNDAPPATSHLPIDMPIPIVHRGGINAVAIATPGSAADKFGLVIAYAAANPPASAIIRSVGEGFVRAIISVGNS